MTLIRREQKQDRSGFTLMELLVVIAIIVALAGVGGYYYLQSVEKSKINIAKIQVKTTLSTACKDYWIDHNQQWPPSLQELISGQDGKVYLEDASAIKDPWDKEYQYNSAGAHNGGRKPDIWTNTPEGEEIGNWLP